MSLRLIPDLTVIRPADGNEVAGAWKAIVDGSGPVALILSRQNTPVLATTAERAIDGVARGGYVVHDAEDPAAIIVATGTEVAVAVAAAESLAAGGRRDPGRVAAVVGAASRPRTRTTARACCPTTCPRSRSRPA